MSVRIASSEERKCQVELLSQSPAFAVSLTSSGTSPHVITDLPSFAGHAGSVEAATKVFYDKVTEVVKTIRLYFKKCDDVMTVDALHTWSWNLCLTRTVASNVAATMDRYISWRTKTH